MSQHQLTLAELRVMVVEPLDPLPDLDAPTLPNSDASPAVLAQLARGLAMEDPPLETAPQVPSAGAPQMVGLPEGGAE